DKSVNGLQRLRRCFDSWDFRALRWNQRPMLLPLGTLQDPLADQLDVAARQSLSQFGLRHADFFIGRGGPFEQLALLRLSGHKDDRRAPVGVLWPKKAFLQIQPKVGLAFILVRSMASKTVIRKNGTNIPVEFDRSRFWFRCRRRHASPKSHQARPLPRIGGESPHHLVSVHGISWPAMAGPVGRRDNKRADTLLRVLCKPMDFKTALICRWP